MQQAVAEAGPGVWAIGYRLYDSYRNGREVYRAKGYSMNLLAKIDEKII